MTKVSAQSLLILWVLIDFVMILLLIIILAVGLAQARLGYIVHMFAWYYIYLELDC